MAVRRPQEAKWANGNPQVSPCRNVRCGHKSEVVADRITRARSPLPPKWVETEASSTGEPVSLWRYPSPEHCSLDSKFGRQCKNKVRPQRFQSAHSAARQQNVVSRFGATVRIACFPARNRSGARLPKSQARRARTWSERELMPYHAPRAYCCVAPERAAFESAAIQQSGWLKGSYGPSTSRVAFLKKKRTAPAHPVRPTPDARIAPFSLPRPSRHTAR